MKPVRFQEVWHKIHNERTVTFAVTSKRTNRALWFTTITKRSGVIWVYAERPYRFLGWMRQVRGRYVIVRGHETQEEDIPLLKAYQWFMDTVDKPEHEHQMVVALADDCSICGRPLKPREEKYGVCSYCARVAMGGV